MVCGSRSAANIGIQRTCEPQREVNEVSFFGQEEQLSAFRLNTRAAGNEEN